MDYSRMTGEGRKQRNADRVQSMVANANKTAGSSGLSDAHELKGPIGVHETNLASGGRAKSRADRFNRGGAVKKPSTNISINLTMGAKSKDEEKPDPAAALSAALAAAPPPPPGPPPGMDPSAGGPPGMPPPGALPGMGMPGMKTGGKVQKKAFGGPLQPQPSPWQPQPPGQTMMPNQPQMPMPGMKRGGDVEKKAAGGKVRSPHMTAGAGSGDGRLEKTDDQRRLRKVLGDAQST